MNTHSFCSSPRVLSISFLIAFAVTCGGCKPQSSPVAAVRGKVELDGQPLASGFVITIPQGGKGAKGTIANGEFLLSTFAENDGALVGTHQVGIVAYENSKASGPETNKGKSLVPERYTNPATSELTIEVKAGEVNTPTLNLTSP